jgi:hypothetical protein
MASLPITANSIIHRRTRDCWFDAKALFCILFLCFGLGFLYLHVSIFVTRYCVHASCMWFIFVLIVSGTDLVANNKSICNAKCINYNSHLFVCWL